HHLPSGGQRGGRGEGHRVQDQRRPPGHLPVLERLPQSCPHRQPRIVMTARVTVPAASPSAGTHAYGVAASSSFGTAQRFCPKTITYRPETEGVSRSAASIAAAGSPSSLSNRRPSVSSSA